MLNIISDGGCDFTIEHAIEKKVKVIPFYITFDQENFIQEGIDISKEDYFEKLISEKNLFPKTSQPNPNDYYQEIEPFIKNNEEVLILTISSKLSGSYNSAVLAKESILEQYPDAKIEIIDSKNAAMGQGLILNEIIKMRDVQLSLEQILEITDKVIDSTRIYVTLDTLEYLKKGGRVGPTTALVGGMLGLRPILQVVDGEISQLDSIRGKKKVRKVIQDGMVEAIKDDLDILNIAIGHVRNKEEADEFKNCLEEALNFKIDSEVSEVGAAIGTHAGPGALAFAYNKKYEVFI